MRSLASLLGRPPSGVEYDLYRLPGRHLPCAATLRKRFGPWRAFVSRCLEGKGVRCNSS
ncbi:homing endonuclease associated repeat-containing protein [Ammonifex degensii]|uniref:homing endonuclease associated repeat-containing protein n=1 Tax=Ammonifex degensii TaxID=42838 RepID=UPI003BF4B7A7